MVIKTEIEFLSHALTCRGDLYQPVDKPNGYTIVMAHGFAGERGFCLPSFASAFCQQGYQVLLFDYRGFGDSDGEPRQRVDPWMQLDDWRQAIVYARQLPDAAPDKIFLWGSSFSGGHVVSLAAEDHHLAGIIAQIPFVSGRLALRATPLLTVLKLTSAGLWDLAKQALGLAPHTIPVVSQPGRLCMLENSYDGYLSLRPADNTSWCNAVPADIALKLARYNPLDLSGQVQCPALIVAATEDSLIPEPMVREMADKIPQAQYHLLKADHFEPYTGLVFEQNIKLQLQFLTAWCDNNTAKA